MSLWTSNMTPPPWIFLSFLYTLYGQVSGKSCEVAIELSILVSWIATTCGWRKSRKASNSIVLPLMLLIFMLMNFNPLVKLLLFVPQGEDLSFFSFVRGTNLFSVSKFTCSTKKDSEKLKNSHFGQIHVQFLFFTVSYWVSAMNEHSLWIHISQLSHLTPDQILPLNERLCKFCQSDSIESETLFLLEYELYTYLRYFLFEKVSKLNDNFMTLNSNDKLKFLMQTKDIRFQLGSTVSKMFSRRKVILYKVRNRFYIAFYSIL